MSENVLSVQESDETSMTESLRRAVLGAFLLPVISLAPVLYRRRRADGEDWFERSPISVVPGLTADRWVPSLGYAAAFVGLSVLVSYVVPGAVPPLFGILLAGGAVSGAGTVVYLYASRGLTRQFAARTGYGILLAVVYTVAVVGLLQTVVLGPGAGLFLSPRFLAAAGFPFLIGLMSGNGYAVKHEELRRESKREGDGESESNIRTDPNRGTARRDSEGQSVLETFARETWMAPDDLATESDVVETRRITPLRDIVRDLRVESTRYEKTVPKPDFQDEKRGHRSDYDSRHAVAPSGFESATYTFFVPGSRAEKRCGNCRGNGTLTCSTCSGNGRVSCRRCQGSGKTECGNCGGEGRVIETRQCSVCGGSGESKAGVWCSNCGGDGYLEDRKRCPNCRFGEVDCDGTGRHTCQQCGGSGSLVQYEYVERTYSPSEDVSYRTKSVPEELLTDADGERTDLETDESPSPNGLYRRQEETREIPVAVATYEYLGDRWEVFEVEDDVQALDFPRDYGKQFRLVQVGTAFLVPAYFGALVYLPV